MTSLILLLTGATSVGAALVGVIVLHYAGRDLGQAFGKMLEALGIVLIFLAADLALGVGVVLGLRGLTERFVSLYSADDAAWLGLALIQGLVFHWWRELSIRRTDPSSGRPFDGGSSRER